MLRKKSKQLLQFIPNIESSKRRCIELLADIPKKIYSPQQKKAIIKENAGRYSKATKKEKTLLLNDLCEILHLSRSYIARLLRVFGRVIYYKGAKFIADLSSERIHKRGRKKVYTEEVIPYLLEI